MCLDTFFARREWLQSVGQDGTSTVAHILIHLDPLFARDTKILHSYYGTIDLNLHTL
jgi:hypothetical protein